MCRAGALALCVWAWASTAAADIPCPQYKGLFVDAAHQFLAHIPAINWRWTASKVKAESACQPDAVSPVGAKGLAQFMDPTAAEVLQKLCKQSPSLCGGTVFDPAVAIQMQAYYTAWIYHFCQRRIRASPVEMRKMVAGAYNAGIGWVCVRAAQQAAPQATWAAFVSYLPKPKETVPYVQRIERYYQASLTAMPDKEQEVLQAGFVPVSTSPPASTSTSNPTDPTPQKQKAHEMEEEVLKEVADPASFLWRATQWTIGKTVIVALIGISMMVAAFKVFNKALGRIDLQKELAEANPAVAKFMSAVVLAVAAIICVCIYANIKSG